jgi:hypothetical protein
MIIITIVLGICIVLHAVLVFVAIYVHAQEHRQSLLEMRVHQKELQATQIKHEIEIALKHAQTMQIAVDGNKTI